VVTGRSRDVPICAVSAAAKVVIMYRFSGAYSVWAAIPVQAPSVYARTVDRSRTPSCLSSLFGVSISPRVTPTNTSGRVDKSRSGDNAVSDMCDFRGVDHSNDLQLNPPRQHFK
jgi:hypothetical protein